MPSLFWLDDGYQHYLEADHILVPYQRGTLFETCLTFVIVLLYPRMTINGIDLEYAIYCSHAYEGFRFVYDIIIS